MNDNMVISLKEPQPAQPAPPASSTSASPPAVSSRNEPRFPIPRKGAVKTVLVALLGIVCSAGAYAYVHAPLASRAPNGQSARVAKPLPSVQNAVASSSAAGDPAGVIAAVGKLIELPQTEVPTIARVSDPSRLQGQPFFAHATTGDVVLMYTIAKKAILYDPTQNKIVEVASISLIGTSTQP